MILTFVPYEPRFFFFLGGGGVGVVLNRLTLRTRGWGPIPELQALLKYVLVRKVSGVVGVDGVGAKLPFFLQFSPRPKTEGQSTTTALEICRKS